LAPSEKRTQAQCSTPKVRVAFCSLDSGQPASSPAAPQPKDEWLAVSLPGLALAHLLARVHRRAVCLREAQALSLGLWLGAVSGLLFLLLVIE
jgi:hypothetical protein